MKVCENIHFRCIDCAVLKGSTSEKNIQTCDFPIDCIEKPSEITTSERNTQTCELPTEGVITTSEKNTQTCEGDKNSGTNAITEEGEIPLLVNIKEKEESINTLKQKLAKNEDLKKFLR